MAIFKYVKIKNYNLVELLKYISKVEKTRGEIAYVKDYSIDTEKYEFESVKKLYNK